MSGGESHLESTESVADERERITVKPRKQNAGEGGNLRGRGNSAGAGVRYTVRPLRRATTAWGVWECVSRVPPLILTKARSPRCAKRNRLIGLVTTRLGYTL